MHVQESMFGLNPVRSKSSIAGRISGRKRNGRKKDSKGRGAEALVQRKMEGRKREPVRVFEKQGSKEVSSQ